MDFITKLPQSGRYDTILTVTDTDCLKASIFIPCNKAIDSEGVTLLYLNHITPHYGIPCKVISDCDVCFTSKFAAELCKLLHIKQNMSTAYHPQTNRSSKRTNQTLEQYLWVFCGTQQSNWHVWLPLLLLALHLIGTEKRGATTCSVAVDNQAALKAFNSELRKPRHHLTQEILLIANQIQKCRSEQKYLLMLRWMAGHISIPGNKKVDREAKKAADNHTSDKEHLPPYLRKPLLINSSAVTRKRNDELNGKWKQDWHKTERGKRTRKIDSTTPLTKFLKTISNDKLSQVDASRIVQLQLQHILLNKYLHRFKRMDKANCLACGEENETIAYFLLHCTKYAFERWALMQQVKKRRKDLSIKTLLGDLELAIPLANYIESTGHFRTKIGEHVQTQNSNTMQENHIR